MKEGVRELMKTMRMMKMMKRGLETMMKRMKRGLEAVGRFILIG